MTLPLVASSVGPSCDLHERRCACRFPLDRELRFKAYCREGVKAGPGRTLNMSSRGLLCTVEEPLPVGVRFVAAVAWPLDLNGMALKLVLSGRVVRAQGKQVAVKIERYEFRTQGSRGLAC